MGQVDGAARHANRSAQTAKHCAQRNPVLATYLLKLDQDASRCPAAVDLKPAEHPRDQGAWVVEAVAGLAGTRWPRAAGPHAGPTASAAHRVPSCQRVSLGSRARPDRERTVGASGTSASSSRNLRPPLSMPQFAAVLSTRLPAASVSMVSAARTGQHSQRLEDASPRRRACPLRAYTWHHLLNGCEGLLSYLTGQPAVVPLPFGAKKTLPPCE